LILDSVVCPPWYLRIEQSSQKNNNKKDNQKSPMFDQKSRTFYPKEFVLVEKPCSLPRLFWQSCSGAVFVHEVPHHTTGKEREFKKLFFDQYEKNVLSKVQYILSKRVLSCERALQSAQTTRYFDRI